MEFRTEHMYIRHWKDSDCKELYVLAKDPELGHAFGWAPHRSEEDSLNIIRTILNQEECYAVFRDGKLFGCVEIYDHIRSNMGLKEGECEFGGWFDLKFMGTGVFAEAVIPLTDHAFDDLGMTRIIVPVYDDNTFAHGQARTFQFEKLSDEGCPELCSDEIRPGTVYAITPEVWHRVKEANKN